MFQLQYIITEERFRFRAANQFTGRNLLIGSREGGFGKLQLRGAQQGEMPDHFYQTDFCKFSKDWNVAGPPPLGPRWPLLVFNLIAVQPKPTTFHHRLNSGKNDLSMFLGI